MFEIKNNEKNKSAVILNPERSEWVSRSHVTSLESVVNDGAKTKRYSAKRDLYARSPNGSRLKMTEKALSFLRLRGASGAQGISATASCREAHKRRFLLNPWILRFANASLRMTIPTIAFLLSLNISTSWAKKCIGSTGQWDDGSGSCSTCGTDCNWEVVPVVDENNQPVYVSGTTNQAQTLNITGSGTMYDFYLAPWYDKYREIITSVNITGVTSVGGSAFSSYYPNIASVDMPNVTTIKGYAFYGASSLTSVDMPNVTTIGEVAFRNTDLNYIGLNSDWRIDEDRYYLDEDGNRVEIPFDSNNTCAGRKNDGKCYAVLYNSAFQGTRLSNCGTANGSCTTCESGQVYKQGTGCVSASECGEGYTDNGHGLCKKNPTQVAQNTTPQGGSGDTGGTSTGGDISGDFNPADCYNKGQVPYDNQCWNEYPFAKKRWTPAEAAQWLHDGNDNFVVITFKK